MGWDDTYVDKLKLALERKRCPGLGKRTYYMSLLAILHPRVSQAAYS